MGTFARDCFLPRAAVPNALSDLRHRNTTPHPCAKNFFKFPAAVLRTLRLSDGDQPSSSPSAPSASNAQRQKLKRSRWVAISPSGVKVKVASMILGTKLAVAQDAQHHR